MLTTLQPYLLWLQTHPHYAGLFIFLVSFSESLAVIGSIVPGSVTMTAIGTLIGAGLLPLWSSILWAILGAILGDNASYWLGYKFAHRIPTLWPFNQYPEWIASGEAYFHRHGGKSVFLGRFIGPLRAIVPVVAGMLRMAPREFLIANVSSAVLWAPCYMLPGFLLGAASEALEPKLFSVLLITILVSITTVWLIFWLIRSLLTFFLRHSHHALLQLWRGRPHPIRRHLALLLAPAPHAASHVQLNRLVLAGLCAMGTFSLAIVVYGYGSAALSINQSIYHLMRSIHLPILYAMTIGFTQIAVSTVFIGLLLTLSLWFCSLRQWRAAAHWALFSSGALLSTPLLKHLIHSARPPGLLHTPSGWSFPSGHTTLAVAFFGSLAMLIGAKQPRRKRKQLYCITTVLCTLIGLSRLYLGAHWATDVLAGVLLGLFWVLSFALSYRRASHTAIPNNLTLGIATVTVLSLWAWQCQQHYITRYQQYQRTWPIQEITYQRWREANPLPLYRGNYLGRPSQVLNIQWLTPHLDQDITRFRQQGWWLEPRFSFERLLRRMAGQEKNPRPYRLPLMPRFYEDKAAAYTLVWRHDPTQFWLLRIWASGSEVAGQPLWIGTLYRYTPRRHLWTKLPGSLKLQGELDIVSIAPAIWPGSRISTQSHCQLGHCAQIWLVEAQ